MIKKKISEISAIPINQLKDSILVVKVGTDDRPAGPADITSVQEVLKDYLDDLKGNYKVIVTHHAIDFSYIGIKGLRSRDPDKEIKKAKKKVKNTILSLDD